MWAVFWGFAHENDHFCVLAFFCRTGVSAKSWPPWATEAGRDVRFLEYGIYERDDGSVGSDCFVYCVGFLGSGGIELRCEPSEACYRSRLERGRHRHRDPPWKLRDGDSPVKFKSGSEVVT